MQNRTVQEFVEDLASDGHDLEHILTVAFCSRWVNHTEEIKKEYRRLKN